jgi:hypothetical protein
MQCIHNVFIPHLCALTLLKRGHYMRSYAFKLRNNNLFNKRKEMQLYSLPLLFLYVKSSHCLLCLLFISKFPYIGSYFFQSATDVKSGSKLSRPAIIFIKKKSTQLTISAVQPRRHHVSTERNHLTKEPQIARSLHCCGTVPICLVCFDSM